MERHIIHFHIPAFTIAVARVSRHELRNRPVAVGTARSPRAVVLSVSCEAFKEGIRKGMFIDTAKKLCPGLVVIPPGQSLSHKAFRTVRDIACKLTPLCESERPGHMFLDLTGTERLWGKPEDTGCRLGREIETRLRLTGHIGIAGNKMVADIASRTIQTHEKVTVIHSGTEAAFMAPLGVHMLPGIGYARRKMLMEDLDVVKIGELAALGVNRLKLVFGSQASIIRQRALGHDPTPVFSSASKPVIKEETTLTEDENDDCRLLEILFRMVERCAYRLRQRDCLPRKSGLHIRYSDDIEIQGSITLPLPGNLDFDLYRPLESLFFKICTRRVRVRFMKIRFWDFKGPECQLSLFDTPSPTAEKNRQIIRSMDIIRQKYGETAISLRPGISFPDRNRFL